MSTTKGNLYHVTDLAFGEDRLVQATSRHSAQAHVVAERFQITMASAMDVARLMSQGVKIESALQPQASDAASAAPVLAAVAARQA